MRLPSVTIVSLVLLTSIVTAAQQPDGAPGPEWRSYLYQPTFDMDYELRGPAVAYCPQPGDIFLATDRALTAKLGHRAALTGAPQHSGIVVARSDSRVALLEGGPHDTLRCRIVEAIPELDSYAVEERVWIRRRQVPLTPEQAGQLTAFAEATDGKRFAAVRMVGQLTVLRSRGPLRTEYLGRPRGDRGSYFCAELVAEACVAAGLQDAETTRPSATYPRDLFFGASRNPYLARHLDLSAWEPPARWTPAPGAEPALSRRFPRLDGDTTDGTRNGRR
jgi:hypothetical protein